MGVHIRGVRWIGGRTLRPRRGESSGSSSDSEAAADFPDQVTVYRYDTVGSGDHNQIHTPGAASVVLSPVEATP